MSFSLTDHGGHQAEIDFLNSREGQELLLSQDRESRVRGLTGKYVVSIDGYASGKPVFFQVERFKRNKKDYWTQYLSNAEGFSKKRAIRISESLRYGFPKVFRVEKAGRLEEVVW